MAKKKKGGEPPKGKPPKLHLIGKGNMAKKSKGKKPPKPHLVGIAYRLRETFESTYDGTQKELAAKIGVTHETLWRYFDGQIKPGALACAKLAKELGTSVEWIMTGKSETDVPNTIKEKSPELVDVGKEIIELSNYDTINTERLLALYRAVGELHLIRGYNLTIDEKKHLIEWGQKISFHEVSALENYLESLKNAKTTQTRIKSPEESDQN